VRGLVSMSMRVRAFFVESLLERSGGSCHRTPLRGPTLRASPLGASWCHPPRRLGILGCTLLCLGVVGAGCSPTNREQLAKDVLKADPDFGSVLEKHRELASRIETYERELALKRTSIEQKIMQMRKDLATATTGVKTKIDETKKQMAPDYARLTLELSMTGEELQLHRAQRASLGRSIAQLRKQAKAPRAEWTAQERAKQQAQIDEMLRDAQRLYHEMDALKQHARLLQIKLLLIKL